MMKMMDIGWTEVLALMSDVVPCVALTKFEEWHTMK